MQTVHIDPNLAAGQRRGLAARTKLIRTDVNRGCKWAFDLSRPYCYDGTTPVANGVAIANLAETYAERDNPVAAGDTVIGGTVSFADGGMDFSAVAAHGNYVRGPATAAAAIWANSQFYLSVTCLKLPTSADWSETTTSNVPFHTWTSGVNGYAANLDIASTGFQKFSGSPGIAHVRQHGAGFGNNTAAIITPASAFGGFAMIASWYRSGEIGLSMTTELGTTTATPVAPTAANSTDFSALRPMRGIVGPIWTAQIANNAHKFTLYSGFDEALGLSGRSVATVLAEHWAREKAKWDAGIYA